MKKRIISAMFMAPLAVFIYLGGEALFFLIALIAIIGLHEFFHAFTQAGTRPSYSIGFSGLVLLYALLYISYFVVGSAQFFTEWVGAWFFLFFFACMLRVILDKNMDIQNGLITFFGVVYIGYFLAHVILTDNLPQGNVLVWLCIISAVATDVFAYFGGYLFGKHKLAPVLSPKKTVEGSVCGVLGCMACCVGFNYIVGGAYLAECLVIGLVGSVAAQFGDLTASMFKRKTGIKDYGNLIPGHGGIMDRFDSLVFTAPFVYYCTVLFLGNGV